MKPLKQKRVSAFNYCSVTSEMLIARKNILELQMQDVPNTVRSGMRRNLSKIITELDKRKQMM